MIAAAAASALTGNTDRGDDLFQGASMYLKLVSHTVFPTATGAAVGSLGRLVQLGDGTDVELPIPFLAIDDHLAVSPRISADGVSGVRLDFAVWEPLCYADRNGTTRFPVGFWSQSVAVRVARAFDDDPHTTWHDRPEDMLSWLRLWGPANGLTLPPAV